MQFMRENFFFILYVVNPQLWQIHLHIYKIFGLVLLPDPHGGHSFSYAQSQVKLLPRKCGDVTRSQPALSRLIFLFPLMPPLEPCQLPLWKQLLIALAQISPSSKVSSKITLQRCPEILGSLTKTTPSVPFQTGSCK